MMAKYWSNGVSHAVNHRYGQDKLGNVYLALVSRGNIFVMPAFGTASYSATTSIQLPSTKFALENIVINKTRWIMLTDGVLSSLFIDLKNVECLWPSRYHTMMFGFSDFPIPDDPNMLPDDFTRKCNHVIPLVEWGDVNQSFIYNLSSELEFSAPNIFFNFYHYSFLYGESTDSTLMITQMETQLNIAGFSIPESVNALHDDYSLAVNFKRT
jgi:hypothetical protein